MGTDRAGEDHRSADQRRGALSGRRHPQPVIEARKGEPATVVPRDRAWTVLVEEPASLPLERVHDSLLALSNGHIGVRGRVEENGGTGWVTLMNGVWGRGADGSERPLPGPSLAPVLPGRHDRRRRHIAVLDMRRGVVEHEDPRADHVATKRLVSLPRPGLVAIRIAKGADRPWPEHILAAPLLDHHASQAAVHDYRCGFAEGLEWAETASGSSRILAVATERLAGAAAGSTIERFVVYGSDPTRRHELAVAARAAAATGFEALCAEQEQAWRQRWAHAAVEIDGDPEAQRAVRFALFHLLGSAPAGGTAAIGARGLTGLGYGGHVFWDTEVFVLPVLAATFPAGARAALQYRIDRLPAARQRARSQGMGGARFPWESASTGEDVTPRAALDLEGREVAIRTGDLEEHISSDVAWAALHLLQWTGDGSLMRTGGRELVVETARYWASRVHIDRHRRAHIFDVIGPDEYHEHVDDNAFTNGMVRWHLRRAAALARGDPSSESEVSHWLDLAGRLVDGYDPSTGRHEQFEGYSRLEPLLVEAIGEPPLAADLLLGPEHLRRTQIVKQPDVLMLHHLVPEEMPAGSLQADLAHYLPRTAHGSSLSLAICASLLARAGQPDEALDLFDLAARIDLDDTTGSTAAGLHLGAMGGLWQAVVFGFAGIRPQAGGLAVDPHLPARWSRLTVNLLFHNSAVRATVSRDAIEVDSDEHFEVRVGGRSAVTPARFAKRRDQWEAQP